MLRFPTLCALFTVAACTSTELDLAAPRPSEDAIYRGTTAPNDEAVVALTMQGQGAFCTGTLITPTIVLTAAHCLEDLSGYLSYTRAFFGANANGSGTTRNVTRIAQHPTYSGRELEADIGLVELATPAPSDVTPIPYLPANIGLTSADNGAAVRFVGYGYTETGAYGERRQFTGAIGKVCTSGSCSYLGDWLGAGSFAYTQENGGPCSGDSGGPAFITRGGATYVAGVTSYGDQNCTIMGVSTTVDHYEAFIQDFIAGRVTGESEDPVTPATCNSASCAPGAPCDADADCGTGGQCITRDENPDFTGGYCTSPCNTHDDCAGDGLCVSAGDGNLCLDACDDDDDCRPGYACDSSPGTGLCLPAPGGGGPSPTGGACNVSSDCNLSGSFCVSETSGFPFGLCTAECSADRDCGAGSVCAGGLCLKPCDKTSECRTGYACWPDPDHQGDGVCWVKCATNSDCEDGESCNEYGLCGAAKPPVIEAPSAGPDGTSARSAKKDSCAQVTPPVWLAALASALALRRRRR